MSSYSRTGVHVTGAAAAWVSVMRWAPPPGTRGRGARNASGRSSCGVWPAPSTTARRAPGIAAATRSARGRPIGVELAGDDERRDGDRGRRSNSGAIAPWPARRRLAASPAGSLPRRIARTRAARSGAGVRRRRTRDCAPTRRRTPRSRRPRAARPAPRPRPGGRRARPRIGRPADGLSSTRRSTTSGCVDREPERDARPERVADDVRRGGVASVEQRRQRVGRRLDRHRLGWRGRAAVPGQATGRGSGGAATRSAPCSSHASLVPVNPWSSRTGCPAPSSRTAQRIDGVTVIALTARRGTRARAGPRRRRPRWSWTLRIAVGAQLEDAHAGPPDRVADRGLEVGVRHAPVLAAERADDRRDVDPVRRPEQLLVVLRQAGARRHAGLRLGQEREDPAAVVVDEHDRRGQPVELRRSTSALRSWRNETSPTTSATGPSEAAAEPSAVDTTPSMPLAPRFERTVIARSVDGSQPSRSRTGIELPAHRTAPSGSAAASAGNGAPSNGSSSAASHAVHRPDGGALRVHPVAGPRRRGRTFDPRRTVRRAGGRGGVRVDERRRGAARARASRRPRRSRRSPGRTPLEQLEDRLGRRHRAGPDDEVRPMGVDPRPGTDELVRPADDARPVVRPGPQAGQRVGEDREAGRPGEARERLRAAPGRRPGPRR